MTDPRFPITFVGAGPGDPELITVKGQRALAEADRVIYAGSLVPEAVLSWCREGVPTANSAGMDLDAIVEAMASGHRAGERVVRLHTGDPSLYGAIHEQMAALRDREIPYRVIPGVTAAFAAAAAMGIEYTRPEVTQTLILTRAAGRTPVPEAEALADLARHRAAMAIYLSIGQVADVARALADAYGPDAPCAVAYRVSQPDEQIIPTRIADLAETVAAAGITRQALILVGPSVGPPDTGDGPRSKLYDRSFSHGFRSDDR